MENDSLFRIISITLFVSLICIGMYHRFRANKINNQEPLDRKQEGWFILISLRFFGFGSWIGIILFMINPVLIQWSFVALPIWARWLGVAMVIVGMPFMFWMFKSLGNNVTDTVVTRKEHTLVVTGIYKYVRHPMYSIVFLMFIGFALLTTSWLILATGLGTVAMLLARTPIEEKNLQLKFGKAYEDYKARTGKFIPMMH